MMDLLAKWNQIVHEHPFSAARGQTVDMTGLVQSLLQRHLEMWWACDRSLPDFNVEYSPASQAEEEKQFDRLTNALIYELKLLPQDKTEQQRLRDRLRSSGMDFIRKALNLEQRHLDFIETSGMLEACEAFARMARSYDPAISAEDIYQASRNVMTMNFMQLLLGLPVEVTPAVFAYSMLYPYTDNYLDDPTVSPTTKLAFNHRFRERLKGEDVRPANSHEAKINELVGLIENQWDRARYPQVYDSLLAIHTAQSRSLGLVAPGASPYEIDVLGISFEKGGTSVLADGYLVAGWISPEQASLMFGYGAFTQLMDDLEDVQADLREGLMTVFSLTARHWPLDGLTNRLFHFGRAVFSDLSAFHSPAAGPLKELMDRCIDPLLIDSAGRAGQYYSNAYLRQIERRLPFRFSSLRKQREKLNRQKINLTRLLEVFLSAQEE